MKKTLIALAAVAVSGAAFAQVTLTGSMGFGVTTSSFKDGTSTKVVGQTDGGVTFAASEDLGGGMSVSAKQTVAFGGNNGGNVTNDGGSIAVAGGFGSLTFGMACASGALGEGVVGGAYNFKHAVGTTGADCREYQYALYTLPKLAEGLGVAVRIQNMAANAAVSIDGFTAAENGTQLRLNYATGPLALAYYVRTNSGEVHASYDLGVAKVSFAADTKVSSGDKRQELGISAPMGATTFKLGYGKKGVIKGTELGLNYALSKRTAVDAIYGSFTPNAAQATSVAQKNSFRVKVVHSF